MFFHAASCVDEVDVRMAAEPAPSPTPTATPTPPPQPSPLPTIPPKPSPLPPPPPDDEFPFTSEWNVENIGGELKIVLPLPEGYDYDFVVDWGDDQQSSVYAFNDRGAVHVYKQAGNYMVKITGLMQAWNFQQYPHSRDQLVAISDLGSVGWRDMSGAFQECDNLTAVATKKPDFTRGVTSMANMFAGGDIVEPDVSNFDTSAVTDMSGMFENTGMAAPDVSNWETSNVTDMTGMFESAAAADELKVDGWDTSSVTSMARMFANTGSEGSMDKTPYLVDWDFSKVTTMAGMLIGQALSTESYSNMLDKIAESTVKNGVYLDAGNSKYNVIGARAKNKLRGESDWTIYDGGADFD